MDRLQSMRVFQAVVDEGGFAAAARHLDLAPAVVTRLVGDLEQHLGVRLLQRTTRRVSLTQAGEAYLARLRIILAEIEEAQAAVQEHAREMSGTVRVLAPPTAARYVVAPVAAAFQRMHPGVAIDVHVSDVTHLTVEHHDITVVTEGTHIDADAIVRTIIVSQTIFCASPAYLERHGEPAVPHDLQHHRCLRLRPPGVRLRSLKVIDPTAGDRAIEVEVRPVMTANDIDTLLRATLDGAGISAQPVELVAPLLREGQLRRVLAPWISERLRLVAVLPSREFMPLRTRTFLDFLIEYTRNEVSGLGLPPVD
ncbi:LysR family transcriptional regulator [Ramlibacter sp.]|uniref:LysR family transcriptional regulator n=1 Tax=Ramlibacter sp. TaxID=1917967 RepID=UPI002C4E5AC2|nr:LysR family transcriptional regulator [Ramlibacter sp.]HWI81061.1 LysR family transcriptional regulator [Ramlibacter sp.]